MKPNPSKALYDSIHRDLINFIESQDGNNKYDHLEKIIGQLKHIKTSARRKKELMHLLYRELDYFEREGSSLYAKGTAPFTALIQTMFPDL